MSRSLPPLTWFRAFEAAARYLNFTTAADELGLTQSAVSQHVRALEERFGTQLFERKPRGLALTDDGRKLLPKVGSALDTLANAAGTFDVGPTKDLLTIATSVSVAQWLLVPRLSKFVETHPGLRVRILSTIWPDHFKASLASVEIRFGSHSQVGAGAMRLFPDSLIAVCSPDTKGGIEEQTLVEAVGTSEGWRNWSERAKFPHPLEPTVHVDSHGLALDLAVNGNCTALTSSLLAQASLSAGKLVKAHKAQLTSTDGYFLAINQESEIAMQFREWLLADVLLGNTPS
ncbi:MAG: LysR family transcriptional regulator [Pseudomonadota bacterium]